MNLGREIGLAVGAGVFMAIIGALGTGEAPLVPRLLFWIAMMLSGTGIAHLISTYAARLPLFEDQPWLWAVAVSLIMTAPLTLVVWLSSGLMFGQGLRPVQILYNAPAVLLICLVMTALTVLTQKQPGETHAAAASDAPPAFLERLPPKLRGAQIYAVQAEDHYLRLHTSKGQDLILMRLADAVAELEGLEGAQVHRSWWVAKGAIGEAERGNGRATLTLTNGATAPVSRTYARALRAAGWF